jgi:hypothetical protein
MRNSRIEEEKRLKAILWDETQIGRRQNAQLEVQITDERMNDGERICRRELSVLAHVLENLVYEEDDEIKRRRTEVHKQSLKMSEQLEEARRQLAAQNDLFNRTESDLKAALDEMECQGNGRTLITQNRMQTRISELRKEHSRLMEKLMKQIRMETANMSRVGEVVAERCKTDKSERQNKLTEVEDLNKATLQMLIREKKVRAELGDEKIENLKVRRDRLRRMADGSGQRARGCDIEAIERLQAVLHMRKIEYANLLKLLEQLKMLLIEPGSADQQLVPVPKGPPRQRTPRRGGAPVAA